MKIGRMEVTSGEKKQGFLEVEGSGYKLPFTVICGGDGPVVLVTAGIHNAEYVGIQAAMELAAELEPKAVPGTVILVPLVNVSGFAHRTMSMVYEDGKNLNREFPAKPEGTVADKICYAVERKLFSLADYYIDLHCGDGYEELYPYVYYVGPVKETVREKSLAMARQVDTEYIVESRSASGGAYNYASSLGIPSVLIERGCLGLWSKEEVEQDKADVYRILAHLYLSDSFPTKARRSRTQRILKEVFYEDSPVTGCWYPALSAGDCFHKGDMLGEIRDYFGNCVHTCIAKANGVMLYQTASLCILKGGPMVAYGSLL